MTGVNHRLADVGELGLIERIASILGAGEAVVGIGDDAAVLDVGGPDYLLATVDMLVEGVHFVRGRTTPHDLGRRALAVNLSDIAAMGGRPTVALTSIALRPDLSLEEVEQLYGGIRDEAGRFDVAVVGGNITRTTGPITIDVTLLGRVGKRDVVLREGARPGDVLAVTGFLGEAAAARLCADDPQCEKNDVYADFLARHRLPRPRIEAGQSLASSHGVHAMMDLSDGLASDVQQLARRSRVSVVIHADGLPISPETVEIAGALGLPPQELALSGGEDYELLVALPESSLPRARAAIKPLQLTVVGAILPPDQEFILERGGVRERLAPSGWAHF